jgi:hypothetical protein
MAENDAAPTEIHVYKPDEQGKNHWKVCFFFDWIEIILIGNTVVIEGEKNWTNKDDPNVTEIHHQKEQIIIENPNDLLSNVTHQLEDIHVTVNNETIVPVENKLDQTNEKATELKQDAAGTVHAVEEKAAEVKHDASVAAHGAQEKAKEVAHNVQGKFIVWLTIKNRFWIEKVSEVAGNTKDAVVAGEKVVEEKLAAAKETILGEFSTNYSFFFNYLYNL